MYVEIRCKNRSETLPKQRASTGGPLQIGCDRRFCVAGIEIMGFEELRRNTEHIGKEVLDRAIQAPEDAAAQVTSQAVEASAPRRTASLPRASSSTSA